LVFDEKSCDVLELMKNHRSVRKFKDEKISIETVKQIIHAAQHAASSSFVQAYSLIFVTDQKKKEALARLTKNEDQIKNAPVFLLFCADMKRLEYACLKQGVMINHDTFENFLVSVVDTTLFAQNTALAAESLGYGICYIGGVRNNPELISEIVELPDKTFPLFGMTMGIPDETQWVKPRLPVEAIIHENAYNEKKYKDIINSYDNELADYYHTRLSNNKKVNWSKTMSDFLSEPRRKHLRNFIASKGFNIN
jgi:FMN reductase (NADPH)